MFATKIRHDSGKYPFPEQKDVNYRITDTGYGKNSVKIMHVVRNGPVHSIREFEVDTHLKLYSDKDYIVGDNSDIIATDSQKNTVYLLAKKYGVNSPEEFGMMLCQHFLNKYRHVSEVHIHVEEYPWKRIGDDCATSVAGGYNNSSKHNHAFILTPVARRYCDVIQTRQSNKPTVISGVKDLRVIKTTKSSFVNFVNDEYRSLPDQYDRIFSTIVESRWEYSQTDNVNFCAAFDKVKEIILKNFAGDYAIGISSPSVQHTLYLTEKEILDNLPQVTAIKMQMPNCHYFNFDTSKFQSVTPGDNNEVFIPTDKPFGIIYAQLDRKNMNKL
ncbi:uricase [Condylostylus longicornis]|uniref:uricase n=1 Tax=Condylostylus longicornis TaxID=2530218 RepID=UPI00244E0BE9|nr:uricase [Condylostylus longicornis]